eukprot:m.178026 g.178026  ORF g.178026 m.178026 type:complete len:616 (-) comp17975_c0_seq1:604-2451(-)
MEMQRQPLGDASNVERDMVTPQAALSKSVPFRRFHGLCTPLSAGGGSGPNDNKYPPVQDGTVSTGAPSATVTSTFTPAGAGAADTRRGRLGVQGTPRALGSLPAIPLSFATPNQDTDPTTSSPARHPHLRSHPHNGSHQHHSLLRHGSSTPSPRPSSRFDPVELGTSPRITRGFLTPNQSTFADSPAPLSSGGGSTVPLFQPSNPLPVCDSGTPSTANSSFAILGSHDDVIEFEANAPWVTPSVADSLEETRLDASDPDADTSWASPQAPTSPQQQNDMARLVDLLQFREQQNRQLYDVLTEMEQENTNQKREIEMLMAQHVKAAKDLTLSRAECKALESELSDSRQRLAQQIADASNAKSETMALEQENRRLTDALSAYLADDSTTKQEVIDDLQTKLQAAYEDIATLDSEVDRMTQFCEEREAQLSQELSTLKQSANAAQVQLEDTLHWSRENDKHRSFVDTSPTRTRETLFEELAQQDPGLAVTNQSLTGPVVSTSQTKVAMEMATYCAASEAVSASTVLRKRRVVDEVYMGTNHRRRHFFVARDLLCVCASHTHFSHVSRPWSGLGRSSWASRTAGGIVSNGGHQRSGTAQKSWLGLPWPRPACLASKPAR